MKIESISTIFSNYLHRIRFETIPKPVIERAKMCVLDCLGAALIGFAEKDGKKFAEFAYRIGAKGSSTIIGSGLKTYFLNAALANAYLSHLCEMDDGISLVHMEGIVVPTALSLAEELELSGKDLISSIVIGYDVGSRISKAVNFHDHYKFWHPTGTVGTFAATAVAAKLLNLNRENTVNAFGLAGTQAAGLVVTWGTSGKPLNSAKAAFNGILAALLSQKGFNGPHDIFENKIGFCAATASSYNFNGIIDNLGKNFEILDNTFKIHASCGGTHPAIDAILKLKSEYNIKLDDIKKVNVVTTSTVEKILGRTHHPNTPSQARFSLPYCVALALVEGKVNATGFTIDKLTDPKLRTIAGRVRVIPSEQFDNYWTQSLKTIAEVSIFTKSGKKLQTQIDTPKGRPMNPVNFIEIKEKFRSMCSDLPQSHLISQIIQTVNKLDEIDVHDLLILFSK